MKKNMEKLYELYELIKTHKHILKIAVTVLVIFAALLFFGKNGENSDIEIETGKNAEASLETQTEPESPKEMFVDISGEVKSPGVYKVKTGTRLFDVVELAGGLTANADTNSFNQAEMVIDGQKIIIPTKGEALEQATGGITSPQTSIGGLININNADSTALQEIPGVGPATAEKIITYRTENGRFQKKEDIQNVSGIGEKTYEKMKDLIGV